MNKLSSLSIMALTLVFLLTSGFNANAKKKKVWKGTITYSISYEGENITPADVAMAPKSVNIMVYGTKKSTEVVQGPFVTTIIEDKDMDRYYSLFEMGDKKYVVKKKYSEVKKDTAKKYDYQVDLSTQSKIIAGYKAFKATVTVTPKDTADGEEKMFDVYYCPEMGGKEINEGGMFEGIPGQLLEFQINLGEITMKYAATAIKKGGVKVTDFLVPTDYVEVTQEELAEKFKQ